MVQWVAGWIPHGGPIEICLVPAISSQLVLSSLWDGVYKMPIDANQNEYPM